MSADAVPMANSRRMYAYWHTNGVPAGGKLTRKQIRRIKRKQRHGVASGVLPRLR